jgi:hypothetical protein
MANRLVLVFSLLFAMLGLGACASGATPAVPTNVPSAAPSQSATPSDTPSPIPTASPSTAIAAATLCAGGQSDPNCELPPGTYSADPFKPGFTFTITEPWTNDRRYADGGGVSLGDAAFFWASGVSAGTVDGNEVAIASGPAGFIAFLGQFKGFTLSEPGPAVVDGVTGVQVDVETNGTPAPQIFQITDDVFNLDAGEKARFILLEKDGTTVIFIIDAFKAAGFDAFLTKAQPVLDSVTWE